MLMNVHHVGVVVENVEKATVQYVESYGYVVHSGIIHDPVQTAYVRFLKLPGDATYLELVAPDGPQSKLANSLNKGGGLNHLCYSTEDIDAAFRDLRARGLFALQRPVAAVAFRGRRIAWLMGRDRIPVELVERGASEEETFDR